MKRALICGITGQDGAFLAKFLADQEYEVWGASRDAQTANTTRLHRLKVLDQVKLISMAPTDFRSVLQSIDQCQPSEIYNLSGQSSVSLSFEQPVETLESISTGTLNILESIRFLKSKARFYNAGSGECFGDTGLTKASEITPFKPCSPYAVAKSTAHWLVANYRVAYNMHVSTGILFNHESALRPVRFVTSKIVNTAVQIFRGSDVKLHLGDLGISRDWGWAPEYVRAMWKMLQVSAPEDYVIATGQANTLQDFVAATFSILDLDWRAHVIQDPALFRRSEVRYSCGDASKARRLLEWQAQNNMQEVIHMMIDEALTIPAN